MTAKHPDGGILVSAGSSLYRMPEGETWYGFIYDLLSHKLGMRWIDEDWTRPDTERSLITKWFAEIQRKELDVNRQFTRWRPAKDTGVTLAFRSLAYDIFCLEVAPYSVIILGKCISAHPFDGACPAP
ncbi:hypothetical protein [uncultured Brevundimonas sp.]|uniref:hypothetical protein n=1 Tax=uncultured Brevundimonas sp. TaxID=213418 RepID=UPI0025F5FD91|nr:hypothetical protein [uncultured Brevundimonas sp.]